MSNVLYGLKLILMADHALMLNATKKLKSYKLQEIVRRVSSHFIQTKMVMSAFRILVIQKPKSYKSMENA